MRSDAPGKPPPGNELVYALPPMAGVLGGACAWHLAIGPATVAAARQELRRQLRIWLLAPTTMAVADLVLAKLLDSAIRHGSQPLRLEVARGRGQVSLALHHAWPIAPAADDTLRVPEPDLGLAQAHCQEFFRTPAPNGSAALVARIAAPQR